MNTIRQYNDLRNDWMTTTQQKEHIKNYWGESFIKFIKSDDKNYISYLVRI